MRYRRDERCREVIPAFERLESRLLLDAALPFPTSPLPGQDLVRPYDVNYDGSVDSGDLSIWQQNYDPLGLAGVTYFDGDLNADGRVDSADLALWQQHCDPVAESHSGEYAWYNAFATDNFGAEIEPLAYEMFGAELAFITGGDWKRPSVEAATIAFETNLPALTYVQFGETGAQVTVTDALGATVFSGYADSQGLACVVLVQYLHQPSGKTYQTPHTVRVDHDGAFATLMVTMDQPLEVDLYA